MSHALSLLNAGRLTVVCALAFCVGAQAWAGAPGKAKDGRASRPEAIAPVSEQPSLALLALGLVGIGLHGLNRIRHDR